MPDNHTKQIKSLKRKAIFSIIVALVLIGASGFGFYLGWKQIKTPFLLALDFHGVKENPSLPWEIRYNKLSDILGSLMKNDFKPLTPDEFKSRMDRKDFSGRNFLLTFDDGLESSAETIKKLYIEKKISSAFFVVTDLIGKEGYASSASLKELSQDFNCRIGLHGKRHYEVTKILAEGGDLRLELDQARATLSDAIEKPIRWYAYPFGEYNASAVAIIASIGFDLSFTVDGFNIDKEANRTLLPRIMYLRGGASAGAPDPLDWAPPKVARTGSLTITLACLVLFISMSWIFRAIVLLRAISRTKEKKQSSL